MSIKAKVAIVFLLLVTVVLGLNNALHYYSTKAILVDNQTKLMEMTAKEISIAIENSRNGSKYVEQLIGEKLRVASIAAKYALDPKVENVNNDELKQLSNEIGVSHITLFKDTGDDIIMVKSSDEKEIGLGTKEWGYWFEAFRQLLNREPVTIPQGQKLPNYWSGPLDVSNSNPDHFDKWGYFYDGTTDYIIDPYVRDNNIQKFEEITGIKSFIEKTLTVNDVTLEITGFNPESFGNDPIVIHSNGVSFIRNEDQPILFGDYNYKMQESDLKSVKEAVKTGKLQSFEAEINGKHVIKSFFPVMEEKPYVIALVNDYKLIQNVLNEQLKSNMIISIMILLAVFVISYLLAKYLVKPVQYILHKVEEISKGNFSVRLENNRKDELGLLSVGINTMSQNLENYTQQIRFQAEHDPLTNLPNRRAFTNHLKESIVHAQQENSQLTLMFLDLDRFKSLNDVYGHTMGDMLLVAVADRFQKTLGKVYRLGGDEFTIILAKMDKDRAGAIAQQIIDLLAKPFILEGNEIFITASIGLSTYPCDGENAETLVKNADIAMYRAKDGGKNTYQFFKTDMDKNLFKRSILERDLRKALDRDELQLYYQPKMDIQTGQITGVEALLRWFHPEFGWVSPAEVIPLAEETDLITSVGEWVLRTACGQNKKWQQQGYPPMRVAVNLSARQFQKHDLVDTIVDVLDQTGLEPQYLELEITEHVAMKHADFVIEKLSRLKRMGIHISIDDFGTGYSSLSYLKKFPIDTLKIDQSFTRDIAKDTDNETIVTTIIAMAHHLKLSVVAEGVEEKVHLEFLKKHHCDEIQGYLISKPLSVNDIEQNFMQFDKNILGFQT